MDLTSGQQHIANRLLQLLADSPMDLSTKEAIIENLDRMPEHHLVILLNALSDQQRELSELEAEVTALVKQHQAEWKALEKQQDATAMSIVDAAVNAAIAEDELEQDLTSLT